MFGSLLGHRANRIGLSFPQEQIKGSGWNRTSVRRGGQIKPADRSKAAISLNRAGITGLLANPWGGGSNPSLSATF